MKFQRCQNQINQRSQDKKDLRLVGSCPVLIFSFFCEAYFVPSSSACTYITGREVILYKKNVIIIFSKRKESIATKNYYYIVLNSTEKWCVAWHKFQQIMIEQQIYFFKDCTFALGVQITFVITRRRTWFKTEFEILILECTCS